MPEDFFTQPILNSPYSYPGRHWELDATGQPTMRITDCRRSADFITPIPRPRKRKSLSGDKQRQATHALTDDESFEDRDTQYTVSKTVNELRHELELWRSIANTAAWKVTPETARLLNHWRNHDFQGVRPFFCQIEAVETAIWLAEVAPESGSTPNRVRGLGKRNLEGFQKVVISV
jgi:type III restriction enzyme